MKEYALDYPEKGKVGANAAANTAITFNDITREAGETTLIISISAKIVI